MAISYTDLKNEIRMDDIKYDPWGTVMAWRFPLANELAYRDEIEILSEWQYRPAGGNWCDPREKEDYQYELYEDTPTADLLKFGALLERYDQKLTLAKMDY